VAAAIKAEESERVRMEALAAINLVVSNANQSLGITQYTAEQCVQDILKQDKSNNAERKPAAKLVLTAAETIGPNGE
jgi:hypothetical protein